MAFTSETKYGYKDGDHIGNWGAQYPVFARVVNGKLYAVAREDNPNHPTPGRFGSMFMCSREWLKATLFAAYKSYGDLFEDKPNNVADSSEPGSSFQKTSSVEGLIKAPVLEVNPVMVQLPSNTNNPSGSTKTDPATTTPVTTPATTATSTNPLVQAFQSATGQTSGTGSASMVKILGVAASIVFMLGGLYFLLRKK